MTEEPSPADPEGAGLPRPGHPHHHLPRPAPGRPETNRMGDQSTTPGDTPWGDPTPHALPHGAPDRRTPPAGGASGDPWFAPPRTRPGDTGPIGRHPAPTRPGGLPSPGDPLDPRAPAGPHGAAPRPSGTPGPAAPPGGAGSSDRRGSTARTRPGGIPAPGGSAGGGPETDPIGWHPAATAPRPGGAPAPGAPPGHGPGGDPRPAPPRAADGHDTSPGGAGPVGRRRGGRLPAVLCGGAVGLATGDAVAGTLVLPAILGSLAGSGVAAVDLQWIVTAYAVPFAAVLAAGGRPARPGNGRWLLASGLALFSLAAAGAALAPSSMALLLARAVQGVGAAVAVSASLWLLSAFSPGRAGWVWPGAAWLGGVVAHVAGGWVLGVHGWRGMFVASAVIGMVLIYGALALRLGVVGTRRFDGGPRRPAPLVGVATPACAGGAVAVITEAPGRAWSLASLALCGGGLLVLLLIRGSRRPDRGRSRAPAFGIAVTVAVLLGLIAAAALFAAPFLLSRVWGQDLTAAAPAAAALPGGALVAALAAGGLCRRYGPRAVTYLGALCAAASCAWVVAWVLQPEPRVFTAWVPASLLLGVGLGAMTTGVSAAAARSAPPAESTGAVAGAMAACAAGGAVGAAGAAVLVSRPLAGGELSGYVVVFGGCMVVAGFAGLAAMLLRPKAFGRARTAPDPVPEALTRRPPAPALPRPRPAMPLSAPVPGDEYPRWGPPVHGSWPDARQGPAGVDDPAVTLRITGPQPPPPAPPPAPAPAPAVPEPRPRPRPRGRRVARHRKPKNRAKAEGELRTAASGFLKAGDPLAVPPSEPAGPEGRPAPGARSGDSAAGDEWPRRLPGDHGDGGRR